MKIKNKNDMVIASKKIAEKYETKAILIKGGHFPDSADDLLYVGGKENWFNSEKIKNENTHGTGCTLSSSIACNLAKGYDLINSVKNAKEYITLLLSDNLNLGKGSGPLNHCCAIKPYIR